MKTMIEEWKDYRRRVIPKEAGEVQLDETKQAFYAGACIVLDRAFKAAARNESGGLKELLCEVTAEIGRRIGVESSARYDIFEDLQDPTSAASKLLARSRCPSCGGPLELTDIGRTSGGVPENADLACKRCGVSVSIPLRDEIKKRVAEAAAKQTQEKSTHEN